MTIAHLSDTHLGFRAYSRTTSAGQNLREADIMQSFEACLDDIASHDPDVVIHAGDFFHVVRPSNYTIVQAFRALSRFQAKRQSKPFVLIGGNHDTPRTTDSGNLLNLLSGVPGLTVVTQEATTLDFPEVDLEVRCLPSYAVTSGESLDYSPTGRRRFSILTMHGMSRQAIAHPLAHSDFDANETTPDRWSYVALGDYHGFACYGPNIAYSGSTDFASTNIWDEVSVPKGWVWFDTAIGKLDLLPIPTRKVIDLPTINAADICPEEVEREILHNAEAIEEGTMPIVRQRIINVHPMIRGRIDVELIKTISRKCLNYQLATFPAERKIVAGAEYATSAAMGMEATWLEHIASAKLPKGVTADEVGQCGIELLREVAERETAPTEA